MTVVTFWPIFAAALANIIIGFIWYNPKVFGSSWMATIHSTPEMMERGKKRMPITVIFALLAGMLIAYVMSFFAIAWQVFDWVGAIELGFWLWAGFVAPIMLGSVLWEMKPMKYFFINAFYWLISLIVMAVVLIVMSG